MKKPAATAAHASVDAALPRMTTGDAHTHIVNSVRAALIVAAGEAGVQDDEIEFALILRAREEISVTSFTESLDAEEQLLLQGLDTLDAPETVLGYGLSCASEDGD